MPRCFAHRHNNFSRTASRHELPRWPRSAAARLSATDSRCRRQRGIGCWRYFLVYRIDAECDIAARHERSMALSARRRALRLAAEEKKGDEIRSRARRRQDGRPRRMCRPGQVSRRRRVSYRRHGRCLGFFLSRVHRGCVRSSSSPEARQAKRKSPPTFRATGWAFVVLLHIGEVTLHMPPPKRRRRPRHHTTISRRARRQQRRWSGRQIPGAAGASARRAPSACRLTVQLSLFS